MSNNVRKRTSSHVRPTKTQISLRIHAVWSESSLFAWRNFASLAIQNAQNVNSDQTARMRRLIWIFAWRTWPKVRFLTWLREPMSYIICLWIRAFAVHLRRDYIISWFTDISQTFIRLCDFADLSWSLLFAYITKWPFLARVMLTGF